MLQKIYKLLDMDIWNLISSCVVFLPLIFGVFLTIERMRLSLVNKKVLNFGLIVINFLNLIFCFGMTYFVLFNKNTIDFGFEILRFSNIELNFGININKDNILFLLFAVLFYFLISLFIQRFFKKKKQFLFTKQRFYVIFSFLIFNTYIFICSPCILETLLFWFMQSVIVFVFAYFDVFKTNVNSNITRFFKMNLVGDFAFLMAFMLLFRYAVLSENLIESTGINFSELNVFLSYMFGISSAIEYKIAIGLFLIAVFSKLIIFPFSCYYSFFANSTGVLYVPVLICANNLFGSYLYTKILPMFEYFPKTNLLISIFSILTLISSLIFLLSEKNIKIIFGYLLSILNAGFILGALISKNMLYIYFGGLFIILLILMKLFSIDKINFSRRLINKNKGFLLEKSHIVVFEKLGAKIASIVIFLNKYFFGIIFKTVSKLVDLVINILVIRHLKADKITILRNIFLVFGLFIIFAIIIILFGEVDFG